MEFQRTGRYDLMYMKTKELGWKETQRIQNIGIEDSQGSRAKSSAENLENYITELYDQPNRPETLDVKPEEKVDTDETRPIYFAK